MTRAQESGKGSRRRGSCTIAATEDAEPGDDRGTVADRHIGDGVRVLGYAELGEWPTIASGVAHGRGLPFRIGAGGQGQSVNVLFTAVAAASTFSKASWAAVAFSTDRSSSRAETASLKSSIA